MSPLDLLVKMEFGSQVYGTTLPTSDVDVKGVYIPGAREILLGVGKDAINYNTKVGYDSKNAPTDKDEEYYSLKKYVNLLLEGQTVALDMLFVPDKHIYYRSWAWDMLRDHKDDLLHSGYTSFVGYCRTQANKYGIKGSRMDAVEDAVDFLEKRDYTRLSEVADEVRAWVKEANSEFISVEMLQNAQKNGLEPYLQVCGRKVPFHATFKHARSIYQKIYDEYGHRARAAQDNQGIDWKALMHAVRIANQAQELLLNRAIVFPRPEAELLLKIRKGELPYQQVAEMIEEGLERIETAAAESTLPKEPNKDFAEEFVCSIYKDKISGG